MVRNLKVNINNLNNREILFGMSNCEDEIFVNHVLMIAKQYLYSCRCKNKSPLIKVFNARIRKIEILELEVAKSKNKLPDYTAKWGKFLKNIDLLLAYLITAFCISVVRSRFEHTNTRVSRVWCCSVCVRACVCVCHVRVCACMKV